MYSRIFFVPRIFGVFPSLQTFFVKFELPIQKPSAARSQKRFFSTFFAAFFCLHKVIHTFHLQTVIHILHRVLHIRLHDIQQYFFHLSTKLSTPANPIFQRCKIRFLFYIIWMICRSIPAGSLFFLLTRILHQWLCPACGKAGAGMQCRSRWGTGAVLPFWGQKIWRMGHNKVRLVKTKAFGCVIRPRG